MRKILLVALATGLGLSSWALARALGPTRVAPVWPDPGYRLAPRAPEFAPGFGRRRVYLDAGHGAAGNTGNRSAFCRDEEAFTLSLAEDVARELEKTEHFEVRLSRRGDTRVPYSERVRAADAWPADVLVSLHSDYRGKVESWTNPGEGACPRSRMAPGFSLLWSDGGAPDLALRRLALARELGRTLEQVGFVAYTGGEYSPTYERDSEQRGVFLDRHSERDRIFLLYRPSIPSVIVETHNAVDDREARRWEEAETRDAFAGAIADALSRAL